MLVVCTLASHQHNKGHTESKGRIGDLHQGRHRVPVIFLPWPFFTATMAWMTYEDMEDKEEKRRDKILWQHKITQTNKILIMSRIENLDPT